MGANLSCRIVQHPLFIGQRGPLPPHTPVAPRRRAASEQAQPGCRTPHNPCSERCTRSTNVGGAGEEGLGPAVSLCCGRRGTRGHGRRRRGCDVVAEAPPLSTATPCALRAASCWARPLRRHPRRRPPRPPHPYVRPLSPPPRPRRRCVGEGVWVRAWRSGRGVLRWAGPRSGACVLGGGGAGGRGTSLAPRRGGARRRIVAAGRCGMAAPHDACCCVADDDLSRAALEPGEAKAAVAASAVAGVAVSALAAVPARLLCAH